MATTLTKNHAPEDPTTDDVGALLNGFRATATAVISDNLSRLPGAVGLRPFHRMSGTMVGRALTVKVAAGDNLLIHQALEIINPGDVIVVDGGGDISRALIGEIMVAIAQSRKAAGFVIDGAIRDTAEIGRGDFPVFARSAIHRGPYKFGPGEINVPIAIGNMVVKPGDIVVGDADGVVAFPPTIARDLLNAVRKQEGWEQQILRQIADGSYTGLYAKP